MASKIHKGDIVNMVAENGGYTKAEASRHVTMVLNCIAGGLRDNDRVTLTGFGTFEVRPTPARKIRAISGVNAGELVDVPAGHRVAFVPGKAMVDEVRFVRA